MTDAADVKWAIDVCREPVSLDGLPHERDEALRERIRAYGVIADWVQEEDDEARREYANATRRRVLGMARWQKRPYESYQQMLSHDEPWVPVHVQGRVEDLGRIAFEPGDVSVMSLKEEPANDLADGYAYCWSLRLAQAVPVPFTKIQRLD